MTTLGYILFYNICSGGFFLKQDGPQTFHQHLMEGCGCPFPGGVQGQVGWGPGQPGVVLNVEAGGSAYGRGDWSFMILEVPSNPGHSV